MAKIELDFEEFESFVKRLRRAANGDFKKELERIIPGVGADFLRVVRDEIERLNVIDTRLLLNSFHQDHGDSVWEIGEDGLSLEVGSNVKYASWVNDGHRVGSRQEKWWEGRHFLESAMKIYEKMFVKMLDARLQDWLDSYFGGSI